MPEHDLAMAKRMLALEPVIELIYKSPTLDDVRKGLVCKDDPNKSKRNNSKNSNNAGLRKPKSTQFV